MTTDLETLELPDCLERLPDGSVRIKGHRVSLYDMLDHLFSDRAEEDLQSLYPTVPYSKLSAALSFCKRNQVPLRGYYAEQTRLADEARREQKYTGPTRQEWMLRMEQLRLLATSTCFPISI
jgi:uncharacterized protein (DUF433 family)